ncbi:MAG: MXAN_5187 C-terminal domain-containing protein [Bradymonadales bacterium]|jgi:hypothetical protein
MAKRVETELSQEKIEAMVEEFAQKLEILRIRYEQYFIGVERVAPSVFRMDVVRLMRQLEQLKIRNTGIKFKLNSAIQKFNAYSAYWNRSLREIEDGVYQRHKQRVQRRREQREAQQEVRENKKAERALTQGSDNAAVSELAKEADDFLRSYQAKQEVAQTSPMTSTPKERLAPTGRRPSIVAARPSDETARKLESDTASSSPKRDAVNELYIKLNRAREAIGLAPQNMDLEAFRQKIESQTRIIEQTHNASKVEYDVVVKERQAFIKPIITKW